MSTRPPRLFCPFFSCSRVQPLGDEIFRSSTSNSPAGPVEYEIRFSTSCMMSVSITARLKPATRSNVARQSAMVLKLSTNQRNDDGTCTKAPEAGTKPPKVRLHLEYGGAAPRNEA